MTAASVALWTLLAGPSRPARVLEIAGGTVYLQVDALAAADSRDGREHPAAIVALLEPGAVQLPIGIVLPPAAADLVPVSVAGSPVSRGEITIGWGAISLAEVRWPILTWWNPGIPALDLPAQSITSGGPAPADPFADRIASSIFPELAPGLARLAAGEAGEAVRHLIGTGPGFVPVGDAVLGGALAALAAWAPDSTARQSLASAVAGAADRTTMISAALLQSAAAGFATPELIRYLTALTAGGSAADSTLTELTAVEAGSGTAMALGVLHQLRALYAGRTRNLF
jgi:hypothetical protein